MQWDNFFEGLETQLAADRDAQRAVADAENERHRVANLALSDRLVAFAADRSVIVAHANGVRVAGVAAAVGNDWVGIEHGEMLSIVPVGSISSISASAGPLLRSTRDVRLGGLSGRITFGFLARDLARRRTTVGVRSSDELFSGTIDRAGVDHLDLAIHDAGSPRRSSEVQAYRLFPFAAIVALEMPSTAANPLF